MPKRTNPFGDHSPLQLKTHVRTKEVDLGVCQQIRMQSVYDKTKAMLFSGANKTFENERLPLDGNMNEVLDTGSQDACGFRQMHLGKNCELVGNNDEEMEDESSTVQDTNNLHLVSDVSKCSQFPIASPVAAFGRSAAEYSPPSVFPSSNDLNTENNIRGPVPNLFQQMMMAQQKNGERKQCGGACHNCRRPVQSREVMKCQFCENYVCGSCARQCRGCLQHFCQLCSVMNYEQSTERAFCLTCSGR